MRITFTVATLCLLTGCASQTAVLTFKEAYSINTPAPIINNPQLADLEVSTDVDSAQFPKLEPQSMWTATGKLSVKMLNEDGKKKGGSAYFVWQQNTQDYHVILTGPLGQGRTSLVGNNKNVIMQSAQTGELSAATPETLFEKAFGWTAPVSYLKYWLEGRQATANAVLTYAPDGKLESVREGLWQADFKNYRYVNNETLPQKIVITGPNINMSVLISGWQTQDIAL